VECAGSGRSQGGETEEKRTGSASASPTEKKIQTTSEKWKEKITMAGLSGMKSICDYCSRSESTIIKWIQQAGFPATKVTGSWESDTDLIDSWRKCLIENGSNNGQKKGHVKP